MNYSITNMRMKHWKACLVIAAKCYLIQHIIKQIVFIKFKILFMLCSLQTWNLHFIWENNQNWLLITNYKVRFTFYNVKFKLKLFYCFKNFKNENNWADFNINVIYNKLITSCSCTCCLLIIQVFTHLGTKFLL